MVAKFVGPTTIPAVLDRLAKPTYAGTVDDLHEEAVMVIRYLLEGIEDIARNRPMSGTTRSRLRHLAAGVKFKVAANEPAVMRAGRKRDGVGD